MPTPHPEQGRDALPDSIASDEIILKRVTAHPSCTQERPGIGWTGTSFALKPRPHEKYPSWSRELVTSAPRLLELAEESGVDVRGWSVVSVRVEDVRGLGLDVRSDPTDDDPGHCLIVPTADRSFTQKVWSKLAIRTRVVCTSPRPSDHQL